MSEKKPYAEMTREELQELKQELRTAYKQYQSRNLSLNMARGKPGEDQLDLSMGMMDVLDSDSELRSLEGADCRNYGVPDGIPEARKLMAGVLDVPEDHLIIYGNSSLNIMYDQISRSYTHGVMGNTPWCRLDRVKFLCVVPGYDRHFRITQFFGIENVPVPMLPTGPDMDLVEKLVAGDESIKGIWCVPKYSNPTGNSYSDETVRRFARLKPAAKDFRIYWDNAYTVHHLYDHDRDTIIEILAECRRCGNPDLVYEFASTSKITFPGSGIACLAASPDNLEDIRKQMRVQTIGHDKINQLRHARYFKDTHGIEEHMKKHVDILRPKFEAVREILEEELGGLGIAGWTNPKGGYFISFDTMEGCAKKVVRECGMAGVVLTPAGATFPGGNDPHDSNIRIAPSLPPIEDLKTAARLLALCTKMAAVEKLLGEEA